MGFAYEDGALVPDGTGPPSRAALGNTCHPATRPGHMLPHAWIERDGERLSTHDLVGRAGGFVLITGPEGKAWCDTAAEAAEKLSVPLTTARIGDGAEYAAADGRWATVREITDEGAVPVRPDHHVAWRSTTAGNDPGAALDDAFAHPRPGLARPHSTARLRP
ncbi:hypothetical protein O7599_00040 [Streptomyces sp. WMMC500]|uniref:aromatic-ring hydroxylase C-terminal domain-containing protein n=1 Tax=Streptomyces sp. WMMC500 TaxID=3015154 RepID=UPI00248CF063|nr:hypothetical protein [Streptomyces sp. WMMC500]WBB64793.1 hypothetical protein O7599_00040 [Streptomyces sp. WMMC500]